MLPSYDEKGKIFTQVISKKPVQVTIQTSHHLIHGKIHIRPNDRLKDELNQSEKFIAITDAAISNLQGTFLYRSKFLTLNIDHIIWMIPDDELTDTGKSE